MTLRTFLTLLISSFGFLLALASGWKGLGMVYDSKLLDVVAIQFLQTEGLAFNVSNALSEFSKDRCPVTPDGVPPEGSFEIKPQGALSLVAGNKLGITDLKSLGLQSPSLIGKISVLESGGQAFLACLTQESRQIIHVWKTDIIRKAISEFGTAKNRINDSRISFYIATREGGLVFSNNETIQPATFFNQPLVQKFISSPLRSGQYQINDEKGDGIVAVFYEIPDTNLILFEEIPRSVAFAGLRQAVRDFFIFSIFLIVIASLLIQIPISRIVRQLQSLMDTSNALSRGVFSARPAVEGFGEIKMLAGTLAFLGDSLEIRDREIQMLLAEQREKARLEQEMAIARDIQSCLLPNDNQTSSFPCNIAARYIPAQEVAGDWYGYTAKDDGSSAVFAIADVSGHGTGSSMFTAVIAALYQTHVSQILENGDPELLLKAINEAFIKCGGDKWHATMLIGIYSRAKESITLYNAGHTSSLLIERDNTGKRKVTQITLPSNPLGIKEPITIESKEVPFSGEKALLLYTDGLTEATSVDDRAYGIRKLKSAASTAPLRDAEKFVTFILNDWRDHTFESVLKDDLCLICLKSQSQNEDTP